MDSFKRRSGFGVIKARPRPAASNRPANATGVGSSAPQRQEEDKSTKQASDATVALLPTDEAILKTEESANVAVEYDPMGSSEPDTPPPPPPMPPPRQIVSLPLNEDCDLPLLAPEIRPSKRASTEPLCDLLKSIDEEQFAKRYKNFTTKYHSIMTDLTEINSLVPCRPMKQYQRAHSLPLDPKSYSVIPPLEFFMGIPKDIRIEHFYRNGVEPGDVLLTKIALKDVHAQEFRLVIICFDCGKRRFIRDCTIPAFCPFAESQHLFRDRDIYDSYNVGDLLRVIVKSVELEPIKRITVTMQCPSESSISLGCVSDIDVKSIPDYQHAGIMMNILPTTSSIVTSIDGSILANNSGSSRSSSSSRSTLLDPHPQSPSALFNSLLKRRPARSLKSESADVFALHHTYNSNLTVALHASQGFMNPDATLYLCELLSLPACALRDSLLPGLHRLNIPKESYAIKIRRKQASQWSMIPLRRGVNLMRQGEHDLIVLQNFEQALKLDPDNVEAYVARGALYANNKTYKRAIKDFERALSLDASHANAKKYIYETSIEYIEDLLKERNSEEVSPALERVLLLFPNDHRLAELIRKLENESRRRSSSIDHEEDRSVSSSRPAYVSKTPSPYKALPSSTFPPSSSNPLMSTKQKLIQLMEPDHKPQPEIPGLETDDSFLTRGLPSHAASDYRSRHTGNAPQNRSSSALKRPRSRSRSPVDRSSSSGRHQDHRPDNYDHHHQSRHQDHSSTRSYNSYSSGYRSRGHGRGGGFHRSYNHGGGGGSGGGDRPLSAAQLVDLNRARMMKDLMAQATQGTGGGGNNRDRNRSSSTASRSSRGDGETISDIERFALEVRQRAAAAASNNDQNTNNPNNAN